jgi:hypothetical protein
MRQSPQGFPATRRSVRGRTLAVAVASLGSLGALAFAAPVLANPQLKAEFAPFADCPVETALICTVADTTSGEFTLGHKTVPIEKTITLQGGLATESFASQPLLGAADGDTLSPTALTVPGGLVGIAGLGGEVTATAEIAGPPSSIIVNKSSLLSQQSTAVVLPLKIKLSNPILGEACYIGSDSEPVVLHLTTGATSPPLPYKSISGKRGTLEGKAKGKITYVNANTLVDNSFTVPGASGCGGGLAALIDPVVDLDVGIPSSAGQNTAIMNGTFEETAAVYAAKYKPKPKKGKKGPASTRTG